ncbi:MAG: nitroreductase family protein [Nanoarchaeota archaeon]|nr:nitroreductase family protein [Nanoarchaeota archaeon]
MEFDSVIKKRKSVRSFKNKKASWKDVLEAIDSANQGPFANSNNNLKFIIIEEPDTINKLADECDQLWMNKAGMLVVVTSEDKHLEKMFGERGRIYSRQQAGAAISTFLLKIIDMGLASCWVGSYDDHEIRRLLKIPEDRLIEAILPIGYEKDKIEKKKKKSLESTIFWEKWDCTKRPEFFEEQKDYYSVR